MGTIIAVSTTAGLTEAKQITPVLAAEMPDLGSKARMSLALAIASENKAVAAKTEGNLEEAEKHFEEADRRLDQAIGFDVAK